jgi:peptidoglycan hydrolase CwlO-like protein
MKVWKSLAYFFTVFTSCRVHIERDLEDIDAAFEKIQSDITNNITEIDQQKRKFLSDISDMRKSFNDHLDKTMFVASVLYRYNRTG